MFFFQFSQTDHRRFLSRNRLQTLETDFLLVLITGCVFQARKKTLALVFPVPTISLCRLLLSLWQLGGTTDHQTPLRGRQRPKAPALRQVIFFFSRRAALLRRFDNPLRQPSVFSPPLSFGEILDVDGSSVCRQLFNVRWPESAFFCDQFRLCNDSLQASLFHFFSNPNSVTSTQQSFCFVRQCGARLPPAAVLQRLVPEAFAGLRLNDFF